MATTTLVKQSIPGPYALPVLGGQINLVRIFLSPFGYLRRLYERYGNVVTLKQGKFSNILAFGPGANFQLLTNPDLFQVSTGGIIKLRDDSPLGRLSLNNLTMMNGAKHRQQRNLMQPAFHKQAVALYRDDIMAFTQILLERWQEQGEKPINVHRAMQQLTQDIAMKTLFGIYNEAESRRVGGILRQLVSQQVAMILAPVDLPGTPYHKVMKLAQQLIDFTRAEIAQKQLRPTDSDVLATLVHAHEEDGAKLSEDELLGHAFTMFAAGHETTTNALTWTLFLLSQHPQISADLLDELDGVLHGEAPTIEQLGQLPLLDGVIKESLRLLPPAAIGIRSTSAPCELAGFALPKGANIIYSEFITQRMPELYEEPNRFKPERWTTLERSAYEYLPFSAGRHRCIGAEFATQEIKVVLPMLLQRYRISVVPNTKLNVNITMRPAGGMSMYVVPQDRQFKKVAVRGNIQRLIEFG